MPDIDRLLAEMQNPGIDWANPRLPRVPYQGAVGQSAGDPYAPIAGALAGWGVQQQPGMWQDLARWAAPGVNQAERFLGGVRGFAGEATGIPAAGRAGEALAGGDLMQAAGQGLMALPSRAAAIPGMLLSEASAQPQDPRAGRIRDLTKEIAEREKRLQSYGNRQFPSAKARTDAVTVETTGIAAARAGAKALQDAMDGEASTAAAAERARLAGAEWARTPFARRYPGGFEGAAGLGVAGAAALPFTRGRAAVHTLNQGVRTLDGQIADAVTRANNTQLRTVQTHAGLARERTQAAHEARQLQAQREQLVAAGPQGMGHLGAMGAGAASVEVPVGLVQLHDYIAGGSDPSGELRAATVHANDPINNTGEVAARYGIAAGTGAGVGGLFDYLGRGGVDIPPGHAGNVSALKGQYRAPKRR